jgi:AbrB family looped-hinge helix DNA binding protein
MITTLSAKGQLVIPRDIRVKWGLRKGDDFTVLCAANGVILLRPVRRRGSGLVKALRGLQGLNLRRQDEPIYRKRGR